MHQLIDIATMVTKCCLQEWVVVTALLLLLASTVVSTSSFVLRPSSDSRCRFTFTTSTHNLNLNTSRSKPLHHHEAITSLQLSPLSSIVTNISGKISPQIRNSILIGSASALLFKNPSKFYPPNLPRPDPAFTEPLPDGSLGCPYLGNIGFFTKMGNAKTGSGEFYQYQAS
jgi:hypothetical protein